MLKHVIITSAFFVLFSACKGNGQNEQAGTEGQETGNASEVGSSADQLPECPVFAADSAMFYINQQCAFGPRVTGTEAHRQCGDYIVGKFKALGLEVVEQMSELTAYDGTKLPGRNIIASINPDATDRILFCAHWDCRPWADADSNEANHHTPILAANDAASGVAVMLEMARLIQQKPVSMGIDFICFDAEDWGMPQWEDREDYNGDGGWCLGSKYWAQHPHVSGYKAQFGVLLDMVGGRGATFAKESFSMYYAPSIVNMVWSIAGELGYGNMFQNREGGAVTDDHVSVIQYAGIPCIDIIPNHQNTQGSSFGPTWHTINDTPENIDTATLKAVGQTLVQMVYYIEKL